MVERNLAKVEVASSRLVSRSICRHEEEEAHASFFLVRSAADRWLYWAGGVGPDGEIGRHSGLKIRGPQPGVPVRVRFGAPQARPESTMSQYNAPFEIHVHGDVPLRADVTFAQLQDALKPLWTRSTRA